MSLFTNHDVFNVHKVLGFGCLLHYGYRIYNKLIYGTMFFDPHSMVTYIAPLAHLTLSLSSFIFHVPKNRFNTKAIIWKELQLHNIIFTSRSVCMMYHALFMPQINMHVYIYSRLGIVVLHHVLADIVTRHYQVQDKTTTRDIPYDTDSIMVKYINKKYYAISQLMALYGMLVSKDCDNGLLVMFPIQLSAFLMTLVRKNIISNNMWHIVYGTTLAIPYITNVSNIHNDNRIYLPFMFILSRLIFKCDKYVNMLIISISLTYYENMK